MAKYVEEMPSQGGTYYRDEKTGKLTRAPLPNAVEDAPPEETPAPEAIEALEEAEE